MILSSPNKPFFLCTRSLNGLWCHRYRQPLATAGLAMLLSACGGGGSSQPKQSLDNLKQPITPSQSDSSSEKSTDTTWVKGRFDNSSEFAGYCESPDRVGDRQGSYDHEKMWLRSWINETYLWYQEVADVNPASFNTPQAYFEVLKTQEQTASGKEKDEFHFFRNTEEWELEQSGVVGGYGFNIVHEVDETNGHLTLTIAYIEENSPAADAGLKRGDQIIEVNGVPVLTALLAEESRAIVVDGVFTPELNDSYTVGLIRPNGGEFETVLQATNVKTAAVLQDSILQTPAGAVGYMLFNDHNFVAQDQLVNAIERFQAASIHDLVLDLRYNQGGLLYVAAQLAYMIAGEEQTKDKTFQALQYNDKLKNIDPDTGNVVDPIPFFPITHHELGDKTPNQPLPTLDLERVVILTSENTCSASESIINGLRGIDVEVIQVGGTTCGKPYGFSEADNCGTSYFSVQFKGVNHKGFGDFSDGFSPANQGVDPNTTLPGCFTADDFTHALGAKEEAMLSEALYYLGNGHCSEQSMVAANFRNVVSKTAPAKPHWNTAQTSEGVRVIQPLPSQRGHTSGSYLIDLQ